MPTGPPMIAAPPPPLVEADGLHKSFGDTAAVRGVSLTVRPGEAYGLVGADGAGKTTLMRLLVGALRADAGHARIAGHDVAADTENARSRLGYLAQRFSMYGDLTVAENVRFFGASRGVAGDVLARRSAYLLHFVGLAGVEDRLAGVLSGGMKQKLGLACALLHEPRAVLLDEPTGGLDPLTRQDFWQLIFRLLADGVAVLVSTPYMDEAVRCTRLGFLHEGAILREGTPRELTAPLDGRVLELMATPRRTVQAVVGADPDVEDVAAFGERYHIRVRAAAGPLERLPRALAAAGATLTALRPIAPALEDAFIALLAEGRSER
ncbi:MAG: ABC transporter ATP-binding protein [Ardenticatenales bacterium]|nr:ABC transporter ATP-binding protein [Ardenticatenales bacterium]